MRFLIAHTGAKECQAVMLQILHFCKIHGGYVTFMYDFALMAFDIRPGHKDNGLLRFLAGWHDHCDS